ncbi:hypothetical protein hairong_137 [Pseudomonas phage hairong]|nr:hypothetical protein hairong_137 [Pseudomonas phage hairong]
MIPESDLKALSGMFADVEPKPVVVQTPDPVEEEEPLTIGFPSGALITARHTGKSRYMQDLVDSFQKLGRSFKMAPGGISLVIHEDWADLEKLMGNTDGIHPAPGFNKTSRKLFVPKNTLSKSEKEAFKAKTRGRLIGRKGW